jgi:hypothetical protein
VRQNLAIGVTTLSNCSKSSDLPVKAHIKVIYCARPGLERFYPLFHRDFRKGKDVSHVMVYYKNLSLSEHHIGIMPKRIKWGDLRSISKWMGIRLLRGTSTLWATGPDDRNRLLYDRRESGALYNSDSTLLQIKVCVVSDSSRINDGDFHQGGRFSRGREAS